MPYIKKAGRQRIDELLSQVHIDGPGELNYAICKLAINFLDKREMSYTTLNDIIGAMAGAQAEFTRRIVVKYEEHKIRENGDIFSDVIRTKNI